VLQPGVEFGDPSVFEQQLGDEKAEPRSVEKLHYVFFEDGFFLERSGFAVVEQDWFHEA
jgi:hypothetical protein